MSYDVENYNVLVSIIIPCFNAENTIRECFNSLKQNISNLNNNVEIIIINDGSTDTTYKIINEYQWEDFKKNVIIINNNNMGISKTRNQGLELAKGKYISFIDSDDIWLSPMSFLLSIMASLDVDLVEFNAKRFSSSLNNNTTSPKLNAHLHGNALLTNEKELNNHKKKTFNNFFFPAWLRFYKKEFLADSKFSSLPVYEDILFVSSLVFKARSIYIFDECCLGYRDNPSSLTNNIKVSDIDSIKYILNYFHVKFKETKNESFYILLVNSYLLLIDNLASLCKIDSIKLFKEYKKSITCSYYYNKVHKIKKTKINYPVAYSYAYIKPRNFIKNNFPIFYRKVHSIIKNK